MYRDLGIFSLTRNFYSNESRVLPTTAWAIRDSATCTTRADPIFQAVGVEFVFTLQMAERSTGIHTDWTGIIFTLICRHRKRIDGYPGSERLQRRRRTPTNRRRRDIALKPTVQSDDTLHNHRPHELSPIGCVPGNEEHVDDILSREPVLTKVQHLQCVHHNCQRDLRIRALQAVPRSGVVLHLPHTHLHTVQTAEKRRVLKVHESRKTFHGGETSEKKRKSRESRVESRESRSKPLSRVKRGGPV